jgi:hypothetical protein
LHSVQLWLNKPLAYAKVSLHTDPPLPPASVSIIHLLICEGPAPYRFLNDPLSKPVQCLRTLH